MRTAPLHRAVRTARSSCSPNSSYGRGDIESGPFPKALSQTGTRKPTTEVAKALSDEAKTLRRGGDRDWTPCLGHGSDSNPVSTEFFLAFHGTCDEGELGALLEGE